MAGKPPAVLPERKTSALRERPRAFEGMDAKEVFKKMGEDATEVVNYHLEQDSLDAAKFILSKLIPNQVNHSHTGNVKVEVSWGGDE